MSEITHHDLRVMAEDIKRDVHASEARLGNRINEIVDRLDRLNGKTNTNAEGIADLKPRVRGLEHEVYDRTDTGQRRRVGDNPDDDLAKGPTWKMVGLGIGALVGIGMGVWEGIRGVAWLVRLLTRAE